MQSPTRRSDKRIAFYSLSALALVAGSAIPSILTLNRTDLSVPLSPSATVAAPPIVLVGDDRRLPASAEEDILWLARCVYSETKKPHEQRLVAWVVRNRVETAYRGASTYRDIVLDPFQFSAFNPESGKRAEMLSLVPQSLAPGWQKALTVARQVYAAPESDRPFAEDTRHFYSERSMADQAAPTWSHGRRAVSPVGVRVDPRRFRFFAGVASVIAM